MYQQLLTTKQRMMLKRELSRVILLSIISTLLCGLNNQFGVVTLVSAFVPPTSSSFPTQSRISFNRFTPTSCVTVALTGSSPTSLFERRWNFNEGQGPFGLKKNAEVWNGRVAQVGSVLHRRIELFAIAKCLTSVFHLNRCALSPSSYKKR
jgi:hypothetical protein